ncbi:MAG: serine hydrolase domain-containing protein [Phycisphaerae bacterium]|jgi:CubicO group peptidase (beta-lactamase class C family)
MSKLKSPARMWYAVTCLLTGLIALSTAHAQQTRGPYKDVKKLPDGVIGERITEFIDTVNANDPDKVRTLIEKRFTPEFRNMAPIEEHQAVFREMYNESDGFEFYGLRKYEQQTPPDEFVVIVRNKLTQSWQAFVFNIELNPPHRIAGAYLAPSRPPSDLPPPEKLTQAQVVEKLETFVRKLAKAGRFSGTVLLAKDGKVLFQAAHGLASRRFDVPNKIDTKFNLGSMNKMFTAVAVSQLVQRGKLSFDDSLGNYLSTDWLPHEITDKIKIKHLLTHTSGLGSYFNDTYMNSSKAMFRELDDYKPLISESTLAFEPGTDWQYSNTGFFLLGVVIEKVTGQNYFDYMRENVYKPAGMINSDCYDMDRPIPNLAIGYSPDPAPRGPQWTNNYYKHVIRGGPAGGGFSTVEDLLRFDQALRSHKLLNKELTQNLWTGKPELGSEGYGFGFGVGGSPDNRIVGHGGGFPGINSNLDMYLDTGYTAVVMSNHDQGAQPVQSKIRELLRTME